MATQTRKQIEDAAKAARIQAAIRTKMATFVNPEAGRDAWRAEARRINELAQAEVLRADPTIGTIDAQGRRIAPAEGDWRRACRRLGFDPSAVAVWL